MRDMIHETPLLMAAAMLAHELNRAYCELLGDESQLPWKDCPQWQQDSALAGVIAIDQNPDQRPEASHEGWLTTKREEGWTYGEKKDPDAKTHPCMVPYTDLSEDQRFKDTLFGAVVRAVLFGVSGANEMAQGEDEAEGPSFAGALGTMTAEELSEYGLTRMMGPDPDYPMVSEDNLAHERALSDGDLHDCGVIHRQPIGATFDGEGVTIIFVDGGVVRWKQAHGWKEMEPVPGTRAAWAAAKKAEEAAAAEKIEE